VKSATNFNSWILNCNIYIITGRVNIMPNVIIYTSNTCPYCVSTKDYLKQKGVAYEERNVNENTAYRKELMKLGYMSVPVLKIDDEVIVGFDTDKIDNLLGQ
jgi:glutaredoxin 3